MGISTLPPFTVGEDVTVRGVTLGFASGDATLADARFAPDGAPVGARCARGLSAGGPSALGAVLKAGSAPSLVLYLRGTRAVVDSVAVSYEHGDERTELRWNTLRLEITPRPAGRPSPCAA